MVLVWSVTQMNQALVSPPFSFIRFIIIDLPWFYPDPGLLLIWYLLVDEGLIDLTG